MIAISKHKANLAHDYVRDIKEYCEQRMDGDAPAVGKYADGEIDIDNWIKYHNQEFEEIKEGKVEQKSFDLAGVRYSLTKRENFKKAYNSDYEEE